MKNKPNTILKSKDLLKPLAMPHVPQESKVEAVIDQWIHAIATDSILFCNPELARPEALKLEMLNLLQENGLYVTRKQFFDDVFGSLQLKPSFDSKFRFIDLFAGIGGVRLGFQQNGGACVFFFRI